MIDVINKEEKEKVKREIVGRNVFIIFDGIIYVVEVLNIVFRFVFDDWKIEQSLVKLLFVVKLVIGEEFVQQLLLCLFINLGINLVFFLVVMRDRVLVNDVVI